MQPVWSLRVSKRPDRVDGVQVCERLQCLQRLVAPTGQQLQQAGLVDARLGPKQHDVTRAARDLAQPGLQLADFALSLD